MKEQQTRKASSAAFNGVFCTKYRVFKLQHKQFKKNLCATAQQNLLHYL